MLEGSFSLDTMALNDIAYDDRIRLQEEPLPLSAVPYNPETHEPLTPAMFHVLLALAGDDLHGYAILKEVELRTGGKVRLSTGTLYGIIKRLLADGLIVERHSRPAESEDDERRRYYRLTPQGREVTAAEAERMDEVLSIARARNLLKKPRPA
jgi:DNA-binding PadR family transcriptional regulator